MKLLIFFLILINSLTVFCQGEEIGELTSNPYINGASDKKLNEKSIKTFDSTFIFIPDTLSLPFFDEFSKNKFQKYSASFSDVGVTSIKKFHLIDNITADPLPSKSVFTTQVTYRRSVSSDNLSHTDTPFPSKQIKIGNLSSYPVVYTKTDVYPAYYITDSLGVLNDVPDTTWNAETDVIRQDSAVQFFKELHDLNSLWLDSFAYHNYRFAKNPRSIGVATFDGLNENGKAYELGTVISNYGDYLTSKPLDLSPYTPADSVYFSFLYQAGGFGEMPDSTDSLVLEFYSKELDQWNWIWSTTGFSNDSIFKVGHICLKQNQYFKKGFQFRFKNYGRLSGGFDHFHLDYVHLRALSGYQDTLFKDFAWIYPINSLLKEYTSVPWDHYKNSTTNKMSDKVNIAIRNGSNIAENNSIPANVNISYSNASEGSFSITGSSISAGSLNYEPRTNYSTFHDFSTGYQFDKLKTGTHQTFEIEGIIGSQFPNYSPNDSTFSQQYFGNYYSYDDGTAEAAYGIVGAQSNLAVRFEPYESDSLLGIMTNFVESATDVSKNLFLVEIWSDNNGKPGAILYKDDVFFPRTPQYSNDINNFYTYRFKDNQKVKVNGPFFIGWRQISVDRLNIGFDKNTNSKNKTFYSLDNESSWLTSSVEGTAMIRPVFSTSMDAELGVKEIDFNMNHLIIYPNPTSNSLTIFPSEIEQYKGIDVFNVQGTPILSSNELHIDLSDYPSGIYFLKTKGEHSQTYKIIKY